MVWGRSSLIRHRNQLTVKACEKGRKPNRNCATRNSHSFLCLLNRLPKFLKGFVGFLTVLDKRQVLLFQFSKDVEKLLRIAKIQVRLLRKRKNREASEDLRKTCNLRSESRQQRVACVADVTFPFFKRADGANELAWSEQTIWEQWGRGGKRGGEMGWGRGKGIIFYPIPFPCFYLSNSPAFFCKLTPATQTDTEGKSEFSDALLTPKIYSRYRFLLRLSHKLTQDFLQHRSFDWNNDKNRTATMHSVQSRQRETVLQTTYYVFYLISLFLKSYGLGIFEIVQVRRL